MPGLLVTKQIWKSRASNRHNEGSLYLFYIFLKAQAPTDLPKATNSVGKPEAAASPPGSFSIATWSLSLQSQVQLLNEKERKQFLL